MQLRTIGIKEANKEDRCGTVVGMKARAENGEF